MIGDGVRLEAHAEALRRVVTPASVVLDIGAGTGIMKIIGEYATKLGVPTPLFSASAPVYTAAMAQGFDKQDTAAVCAVLEAMAGLKR